jgi:hypothetical protein
MKTSWTYVRTEHEVPKKKNSWLHCIFLYKHLQQEFDLDNCPPHGGALPSSLCLTNTEPSTSILKMCCSPLLNITPIFSIEYMYEQDCQESTKAFSFLDFPFLCLCPISIVVFVFLLFEIKV